MDSAVRGIATKFREKLDSVFAAGKQAGESAMNGMGAHSDAFPRVKSFDEFLNMIQHCNNLLDAKRFRHQIINEMKRKETQASILFFVLSLFQFLESQPTIFLIFL